MTTKLKLQRKDYMKKRNIVRNKPRRTYEREIPVLMPVLDRRGKLVFKDGQAVYKVIGSKKITEKNPHEKLFEGKGILPKSKKYRLSKKQKGEYKTMSLNAKNKTATNT